MNEATIVTTYMWALVIMLVLFMIAVIIANMVVYKPKDPGTTTRRVWFWILCVLSGVSSYIINFVIASKIGVPTIKQSYLLHSAIASGVAVVVYIILGFCISKIFSKSKVGTWF